LLQRRLFNSPRKNGFPAVTSTLAKPPDIFKKNLVCCAGASFVLWKSSTLSNICFLAYFLKRFSEKAEDRSTTKGRRSASHEKHKEKSVKKNCVALDELFQAEEAAFFGSLSFLMGN
jgi:hypothetical protein